MAAVGIVLLVCGGLRGWVSYISDKKKPLMVGWEGRYVVLGGGVEDR